MGVKEKETRRLEAPWWLTWLLLGGLVLIFASAKIVDHLQTWAPLFAGVGALLVLVVVGWRAAAWAQAEGVRKRVEMWFLLGSVGCLLAIILYSLTGGGDAFSWLKVEIADPKKKDKFEGIIGVLWPMVLGISLIPMILATFAETQRKTTAAGQAPVDAFRIGEAAGNGLTIAFAGAMLFLVCYVASERDEKWDLSYFRTSAPGSATHNMMGSQTEPLRVLLFFPSVNEVKDEVKGYFSELSARTGRVQVEEHDRFVSAKLAKDYKVTKDGTVVLVKGDRSEIIAIGTELKDSRAKLKSFDEEVQKAFMKLARTAKTAYLTVGHGEMNDPGAENTTDPPGMRSASAIKQLLGLLNYKVKDFGLPQGSAQEVPDDAAIVVVMGPTKPFLDQELQALDRYLAKGGSILIALDPGSETTLGPLEARLGVKFDPTPLSDDKQYYPIRREKSDTRWLITDQFSSHASVTTLSRSRVLSGILSIGPGSLVDAPATGGAKKTYVVRTRTTSFNDPNGNYEFDGDEKRQSYNLVAAIEGPKLDVPPEPPPDPKKPEDKPDDKTKKKPEARQMRAVVFADAELVGDFLLSGSQLNAALIADTFKWAGGEEQFMGETRSEKDVPIEHTKGQDRAWFYSTVVGAPILVLAGGLWGVFRRRKRGTAAREEKKS
jgi:hypothetical protein